jgi:hypothetical protein
MSMHHRVRSSEAADGLPLAARTTLAHLSVNYDLQALHKSTSHPYLSRLARSECVLVYTLPQLIGRKSHPVIRW